MAGDTSEQTSSSSEISHEEDTISLEELIKRLAQESNFSDEQVGEAWLRTIKAIEGLTVKELPLGPLLHNIATISGTDLGTVLAKALVSRNEFVHGIDRPVLTEAIHFPIQILEEPLTAQSLFAIIAAITDLHARCWLIQQKRFSDLMDYAQTRDPRFFKEANLQVGIMTHNSPALIDFLITSGGGIAGAATLAFALKKGIDAVMQTPLRFQATKLKNEREVLEQKIREQEAQQEQNIAAQKAQLDLERQQLELERQRLEFEKNRVKIVLEIATTMVGQLQSDINAGEKEMIVHSLVPPLLQFAALDATVTVLSVTQPSKENKESSEDK